jgi:hypothetical protein
MTWRVWQPRWQDVFVSQLLGSRGSDQCLGDFSMRWAGCVAEDDWQVLRPEHEFGWYRLQLRLPVIIGERESEAEALLLAGQQDGLPGLVVVAGSQEDCRLQDYGRRQLRT